MLWKTHSRGIGESARFGVHVSGSGKVCRSPHCSGDSLDSVRGFSPPPAVLLAPVTLCPSEAGEAQPLPSTSCRRPTRVLSGCFGTPLPHGLPAGLSSSKANPGLPWPARQHCVWPWVAQSPRGLRFFLPSAHASAGSPVRRGEWAARAHVSQATGPMSNLRFTFL